MQPEPLEYWCLHCCHNRSYSLEICCLLWPRHCLKLVLKRMYEYLQMNSKFLIFEWKISIRIFGHMLNDRLQRCKLYSVELFHYDWRESDWVWEHFTLNESKDNVISNSVQLVQVALFRKEQPNHSKGKNPSAS